MTTTPKQSDHSHRRRATFRLARTVVALLAILAGAPERLHASTSWCPAGTAFNPNPGDFYPGTGWYPSGSVYWYPWWVPTEQRYKLEDFSGYGDGELIVSSANKSLRSHLVGESGTLYARHINYNSLGQYVGWRRAYTSTYDFRMLVQGWGGGQKMKWTDGTIEAKFYVDAWQTTSEPFQGVHLFGRYRSDDDNYAVSLRRDNTVTIKKEVCHQYTTLASGPFRAADGSLRKFETKRWYTLTMNVTGSTISFYVDGVLQARVSDPTFSWGTFGVRTDYANVYLDDLLVY